jgi:hypothetical protein
MTIYKNVIQKSKNKKFEANFRKTMLLLELKRQYLSGSGTGTAINHHGSTTLLLKFCVHEKRDDGLVTGKNF